MGLLRCAALIGLSACGLLAGCASHCPDTCGGCCDSHGQCQGGALPAACGASGNACQACDPAVSCVAGHCVDTRCGPQNCAGCCGEDGGCVSLSNTPQACGVHGNACAVCPALQFCDNGTCAVCGPATCAGCCDSAGGCVAHRSEAQCGSTPAGGSGCQACDAGESCAGGVCQDLGDGGAPPAIPLVGCVNLTYSAPMQLGSTTMRVIIDTGSSTTAVASVKCGNCLGVSPRYTDTGTDQMRGATGMYADGSGWSGEIWQDLTAYGPFPAYRVPLDFVAIGSQSMFFTAYDCAGNPTGAADVQGISGMGGNALLEPGTTTYFGALVDAGLPNVFAVQMCDNTGSLWLGGFDPRAMGGPVQYTSLVSGGFTTVGVKAMAIGATAIPAPDINPSIVDTGTSLIGLASSTYANVTSALEGDPRLAAALVDFDAGLFAAGTCLPPNGGLTTAQLDAALPTLSFTFTAVDGSTFTLTSRASQSYLYPLRTSGGVAYCPGIFSAGQGGGSILGDTFISAYAVVFDEADGRMGFAPSAGCTDQLVAEQDTPAPGPVPQHTRRPRR